MINCSKRNSEIISIKRMAKWNSREFWKSMILHQRSFNLHQRQAKLVTWTLRSTAKNPERSTRIHFCPICTLQFLRQTLYLKSLFQNYVKSTFNQFTGSVMLYPNQEATLTNLKLQYFVVSISNEDITYMFEEVDRPG